MKPKSNAKTPAITGNVIHRHPATINGLSKITVRKGATFLSMLLSMSQPGTVKLAYLCPDYGADVEAPTETRNILAIHTGVPVPPMTECKFLASVGPAHFFEVSEAYAAALAEFFPSID